MARPRKDINKKQFESLCGIQCTKEEVCDVLDITDKTLDRWVKEEYGESFSEVFRRKRNLGKASLRRTQWELAKKNVPMAIFLGKNLLGQADKIETANTNINTEVKMTEEERRKRIEMLKAKL